jgi:heavy metal efflux system protein
MIDALVAFVLRKRLVVAMISLFIAFYGYYSWTQLAIEAYPDIADVTSQVITQAPGLAAEEVEPEDGGGKDVFVHVSAAGRSARSE